MQLKPNQKKQNKNKNSNYAPPTETETKGISGIVASSVAIGNVAPLEPRGNLDIS